MTIKSSLSTIGRKEQYKPALKELVNIVNDLVGHTFSFFKFIFINEFEKNDQFEEVFLAVVDRQTRDDSITGKSQLSNKARMERSPIRPYIEKYCQHTSYTPIKLTNAQQIAKYEGTKIHTAYINNITLHFGNQLRRFLNSVSKKQEKKSKSLLKIWKRENTLKKKLRRR
jgi:hypothetical protein